MQPNSNKQTLVVIADTSGSMAEMGKVYLARNLMRFISQLPLFEEEQYAAVTMRFFAWSEGMDELYAEDGFDPVLYTGGSADAVVLIAMINQMQRDEPNLKCLLLSDGSFGYNDITGWPVPGVAKKSVAVGADTDNRALAWFSDDGDAYLAEDIRRVTEALLFSSLHPEPPKGFNAAAYIY